MKNRSLDPTPTQSGRRPRLARIYSKGLHPHEITHVRYARNHPLFPQALEFIRAVGTLGFNEVVAQWDAEVRKMDEDSGGGDE